MQFKENDRIPIRICRVLNAEPVSNPNMTPNRNPTKNWDFICKFKI